MFKAGVEGAHAPGGMKFCFFFSEKISLLLFIDMFLEIGTRMIYRYQIFFPQAECRILQHPCFLIEHMINAAFTCGTEDLRELPRYFECCV